MNSKELIKWVKKDLCVKSGDIDRAIVLTEAKTKQGFIKILNTLKKDIKFQFGGDMYPLLQEIVLRQVEKAKERLGEKS